MDWNVRMSVPCMDRLTSGVIQRMEAGIIAGKTAQWAQVHLFHIYVALESVHYLC